MEIGFFHKQPLDDIPPFKAILVSIVVSFAVLPCCVQKVWELPSIKRAHYTIRHANFFRHFSDCKQIMVKIALNCKTSQSQGIHLQKWDKVMAVWKIFMSPHILIIEFDLSQWQIAFSHCFQRLKYVSTETYSDILPVAGLLEGKWLSTHWKCLGPKVRHKVKEQIPV